MLLPIGLEGTEPFMLLPAPSGDELSPNVLLDRSFSIEPGPDGCFCIKDDDESVFDFIPPNPNPLFIGVDSEGALFILLPLPFPSGDELPRPSPIPPGDLNGCFCIGDEPGINSKDLFLGDVDESFPSITNDCFCVRDPGSEAVLKNRR
jgi:hypothetical protein